jgi:hypothetical protein
MFNTGDVIDALAQQHELELNNPTQHFELSPGHVVTVVATNTDDDLVTMDIVAPQDGGGLKTVKAGPFYCRYTGERR